jgi:hypothetical protein
VNEPSFVENRASRGKSLLPVNDHRHKFGDPPSFKNGSDVAIQDIDSDGHQKKKQLPDSISPETTIVVLVGVIVIAAGAVFGGLLLQSYF